MLPQGAVPEAEILGLHRRPRGFGRRHQAGRQQPQIPQPRQHRRDIQRHRLVLQPHFRAGRRGDAGIRPPDVTRPRPDCLVAELVGGWHQMGGDAHQHGFRRAEHAPVQGGADLPDQAAMPPHQRHRPGQVQLLRIGDGEAGLAQHGFQRRLPGDAAHPAAPGEAAAREIERLAAARHGWRRRIADAPRRLRPCLGGGPEADAGRIGQDQLPHPCGPLDEEQRFLRNAGGGEHGPHQRRQALACADEGDAPRPGMRPGPEPRQPVDDEMAMMRRQVAAPQHRLLQGEFGRRGRAILQPHHRQELRPLIQAGGG